MTSSAEIVLGRLARPYDPVKVVSALLGTPARLARQIVGTSLATSEEADRLLDRMPRILRSLAIATTDRPERCYGELRGPVLWSETIASRSASAGDPGLFVCATTTKAYDTDENRLLKTALDTLRRAGADSDGGSAGATDEGRRARHNGLRAGHLLEHRALSAVPITRISGREMTRTRSGSRRATYQPAVDVLRRAAHPLSASLVAANADEATIAQIGLLAEALTVTGQAGHQAPLRSAHGTLTDGLVTYDHLAGVTVGSMLVTTSDQIGVAWERVAGDRTAAGTVTGD